MSSGVLDHPPGEAAAIAQKLVDLTRAMHCAIEATEYDQLPALVEERQRQLDRLLARPVVHDVAAVRSALEQVVALDRTTAAFLAAEIESIRSQLAQVPVWRKTLGCYRPPAPAGGYHLDRVG